MERMRIVTLYGPKDFRIEEIDKPRIGEDGVLVRLRSHGVCVTNVHWWEGYGRLAPEVPVSYPVLGGLGHEFCGEVAEVGPKVTRVKVGDRVAMDPFESAACGFCSACHCGSFSSCKRPRPVLPTPMGFMEYISLYEKGVYKLPDNVSLDEGILTEPFACAVRAVRRGFTPGDSVLILGSGISGMFAIGAAKHLGASKILVTYKYDHQGKMAEAAGADVVLRGTDPDIKEKILAHTNNNGPDLVVESVGGSANTLQLAIEAVRPLGKVIVYGTFNDPVPIDTWQVILKEISLVAAVGHGRIDSRLDFDIALEIMAAGKFPFKPMITHRYPLEKITEAFVATTRKDAQAVKVVKAVINT